MSLEDRLAENTAAMTALTAALLANSDILGKHHSLIGGLAGKIPGASGAAAPAANTTETVTPPKRETAAEKKAREKTEAEDKKKAEEAAKKNSPVVTIETVRSDITSWLSQSVTGSQEMQAKRDELARIIKHFGVEKVTDVPADRLAEFHSFFESIKNGEDPLPADEAEAEPEVDPLL